ncbi:MULTISPECIES: DUF1775 domain-containing protein [Amycolatopsis]|uniref:YcnI family protein n=2 Tax=Amycolatopsis TaxID=1813 RepID=A0ABP9R950_9PSEU
MSRKAFARVLCALAAVVLGPLAGAVPAAAQVSIVPDRVDGGGMRTFAFRLANERTDTRSTQLELVFPQNPPIAYVEVAPVPGWTVTVRPRPLEPPVAAGGKVISEVAGALVFAGGSVAPREFEQFLVTMGPLPADGQLAFEATQSFANGAIAHWNGQTSPAPVITVGSGAAPAAAPASAAGGPAKADGGTGAVAAEAAPRASGTTGGPPFAVLWGAVGLALVVIAVVWYRARRRRETGAGTR